VGISGLLLVSRAQVFWDHARIKGHRFFAAVYDRMLAGTERAGLAEMRAEVLSQASGRTLEIGGGTGLNLARYPRAVGSLTVTEPDPHMARRARERVAAEPPPFPVDVVEAGAERLPFADGSFDTVVSTLVLCTVSDADAAAAEVRRVLAPGGRLLLLEHVRDPDEGPLARWQDRLERPWGWFAAGCHPNRDTAATLRRAGFELELVRDELPKAPPLARPMVRGSATVR
jgi:ubiquinone/menaquinone biosynthesis C-methylase UbiE